MITSFNEVMLLPRTVCWFVIRFSLKEVKDEFTLNFHYAAEQKQLNFGDDHHQKYWQALAGSHYSQKFSPSVSFYLSIYHPPSVL